MKPGKKLRAKPFGRSSVHKELWIALWKRLLESTPGSAAAMDLALCLEKNQELDGWLFLWLSPPSAALESVSGAVLLEGAPHGETVFTMTLRKLL
jgi:hypothetical protein